MPNNASMRQAIEVAAKTDVGCVRTENQDSFGYDCDRGILVLCDGMGGQAAGQVASEIGVSTVLSFFREDKHAEVDLTFPDDLSEEGRVLGSAVMSANEAIRAAAATDVTRHGMGTTIVAALVRAGTLTVAHVGDSRIYLVRNGVIEQLTNDHSLVMEQVRRGLMTLEEAAQSPMQNVITRALGVADMVEPDIAEYDLIHADTLLFCSDGLTRHVSDDRILDIIAGASSLEAACDELIAVAKHGGGSDNVTCLLARCAIQD
jgi:serine/threonine protein phosphatase PrpC